MIKNGNPKPSPGSIRTFVADASDPVNLEFGPDGSLYYVDFNGGTIKRVSYGVPPSGGPTYNPPVNYSTGTNAHGVATANLNGDGKLDLAVANSGASSVSVLLGNGDGSFGTASNFAVGSQPKSVTASDFNGDGNVDLATANQGSNTVSILLGNGTGSFTSAGSHSVCPGTHEVAVGEFNGDGRPDLAVACWGGTVISVLLGNGSRRLRHGDELPGRLGPDVARRCTTSTATGATTSPSRTTRAANVSILIGNGNGTFAAPVELRRRQPGRTRSAPATSTATASLDLVTANDGSSNVTLLRGVGNGTFTAIASYPTGSVPKGIAVGDFNGDGKLDVVTANTAGRYPSGNSNPGGDQVSILLGSGTGTLGAPTNHQTGNTPFAVAHRPARRRRAARSRNGQLVRQQRERAPDQRHRAAAATTRHPVPLRPRVDAGAPTAGGRSSATCSNGEAAAGDGRTHHPERRHLRQGARRARRVRRALRDLELHALQGRRRRRRRGRLATDPSSSRCTRARPRSTTRASMTGTTATRQVDVAITGATRAAARRDRNGNGVTLRPRRLGERADRVRRDTTPPTVTQRTPTPGATRRRHERVADGDVLGGDELGATLTTSDLHAGQAGAHDAGRGDASPTRRDRDRDARPDGRTSTERHVHGDGQGRRLRRQGRRRQPARRGRDAGPSRPGPAAATTTYVSDMTWTQATNGWGPVEKDMSNGESGAGDGRTITLNGVTYSKGLGVHAISDVRYAIANCTRFKASVGVDDEVGSQRLGRLRGLRGHDEDLRLRRR